MSIEQIKELGDALKQRDAEVKSFLNDTNARLTELEQKSVSRNRNAITEPREDITGKFASSDQLKAMVAGAGSTGRVQFATSIKAITPVTTGDAGTTARWSGLGEVAPASAGLVSALPVLPVTGSSFEYVQLDGYTNAANTQATEGSAKAQANVVPAIKTAHIATIAHYAKVSAQVLQDNAALQQQLGSLLQYGVIAKLEDQIINGSGNTGYVGGLLVNATSANVTANTAYADQVSEAIVTLQTAGWEASTVVMNPVDWRSISTGKLSSGEYIMGSPRDPAPASLWSVPVVLAPSLAQGTAIVMDASQVALLDRQSAVVMASRDDGTNFTSNLVTLLGELRAGLAVFSPSAVLKVTLG